METDQVTHNSFIITTTAILNTIDPEAYMLCRLNTINSDLMVASFVISIIAESSCIIYRTTSQHETSSSDAYGHPLVFIWVA